MSEEMQEKIRSMIEFDPRAIQEIILFMAQVCEEKWTLNIAKKAGRKWGDRHLALQAVSSVLKEDSNG